MSTATDGMISISYRPLATMDELHVLLLAAISVQTNDHSPLEQVFSLPSNVIVKELSILEAYGLATKPNGVWTVTARGQRLTSVWKAFQNRAEAEIRASGKQWLLGPGEFGVDEIIRDKDEIEELASGFEIADAHAAAKFLAERRRIAASFESFVLGWPSQSQAGAKLGEFADVILFDNLKLAESDELLTRLEELFSTHIAEVVDHSEEKERTIVHLTASEKASDAVADVRKQGQKLLTKFDEARRSQRKTNQHLSRVKMVCEAILSRKWLSSAVGSLGEAFDAEPAAFVFRSTVPLVEPQAEKQPSTSRSPTPRRTPKPKQEEEGVLRSLFRWLLG